MIFPRYRTVVFVDGCFWHRCPSHFQMPKNNSQFWNRKIMQNVRRDRAINEKLRKDGWKVLRVWEHEVKEDLPRAVDSVIKTLNK